MMRPEEQRDRAWDLTTEWEKLFVYVWTMKVAAEAYHFRQRICRLAGRRRHPSLACHLTGSMLMRLPTDPAPRDPRITWLAVFLALVGVALSSLAAGLSTWAVTSDPLNVSIGLFQVGATGQGLWTFLSRAVSTKTKCKRVMFLSFSPCCSGRLRAKTCVEGECEDCKYLS